MAIVAPTTLELLIVLRVRRKAVEVVSGSTRSSTRSAALFP
jgi:hypothetical protein